LVKHGSKNGSRGIVDPRYANCIRFSQITVGKYVFKIQEIDEPSNCVLAKEVEVKVSDINNVIQLPIGDLMLASDIEISSVQMSKVLKGCGKLNMVMTRWSSKPIDQFWRITAPCIFSEASITSHIHTIQPGLHRIEIINEIGTTVFSIIWPLTEMRLLEGEVHIVISE
jgi:hypothetical protein